MLLLGNGLSHEEGKSELDEENGAVQGSPGRENPRAEEVQLPLEVAVEVGQEEKRLNEEAVADVLEVVFEEVSERGGGLENRALSLDGGERAFEETGTSDGHLDHVEESELVVGVEEGRLREEDEDEENRALEDVDVDETVEDALQLLQHEEGRDCVVLLVREEEVVDENGGAGEAPEGEIVVGAS